MFLSKFKFHANLGYIRFTTPLVRVHLTIPRLIHKESHHCYQVHNTHDSLSTNTPVMP